jgi:hypothetical protein
MSEETDRYLAELETAEAEAAGLLDGAGPDGEGLNPRASAALRHTRKILNQHKKAIERVRQETAAEVREQMIAERKTEAGFRRLGVPESARVLFSGVDASDEAAMQARAVELQKGGISWDGQPLAPTPPQPDPNVDTVAAMQLAAAGGNGTVPPWDVEIKDMAAHPERYSDEQRDQTVKAYDRAVDAAARKPGAGALG